MSKQITVDDKLRFRMKWINIFGWLSVFTVVMGVIGWLANGWIMNPANKLDPSQLWGVAIPLFGAVGGLFWTHSATTPANTVIAMPEQSIPVTTVSQPTQVVSETLKQVHQEEVPRTPLD